MRIRYGIAVTGGLALGATLAVAPGGASAQGFSVNEHGTCVMGRAGTGVALPCEDGSTIVYNPAGLVVGGEGWMVTAGGTVIAAGGGFTFDRTGREVDLDNDPIPVPHAYVRYGWSDRLALGVGLYAPYGLGTTWPREVDGEVFSGAFAGYDNHLASPYVQPTVAYRLTDRISVGAGLTVVTGASVELNSLLDLSEIPTSAGGPTFGQLGIPRGTAFASSHLEGDADTELGFNVGARFEVTDALSFGVRYLSEVELHYEGVAAFNQLETGLVLPPNNPFGLPAGTPVDAVLQGAALFTEGPFVEQAVRTRITMPSQFVAGVAYGATRRLTLLFDWQWTDWSVFDVVPLEFEILPDDERVEDFEDTHAFRFGAEYDWDEFWDVRLGYLRHGAAAPDETVTPLLPENTRNEFTAGLGWDVPGGFVVDVAYQYIDQDDRRGRTREPTADLAAPTDQLTDADFLAANDGLFSFNAHLFAATLSYHF